jgi:hypothetical protein
MVVECRAKQTTRFSVTIGAKLGERHTQRVLLKLMKKSAMVVGLRALLKLEGQGKA